MQTGTKIELSEWLKEGRKNSGLSLREVSKQLDNVVSPSYISLIEGGLRKRPSMEILTKLAKVLNLDIRDVSEIPMGDFDQTDFKNNLSICLDDLQRIKKNIDKMVELNGADKHSTEISLSAIRASNSIEVMLSKVK